ncbi:hypothetical protein HFO99_24340 [Rhizobium leguminosarum]|uniref:hypothetical protein n=1 Tax=Rhizobium leguminosarum TaxID=384 RepID=UPI001C952C48|nr:hypothetical protein [Rhizobium leguminosarum]MBY5337003.1 hypothetical protein [Rhizobium leguminosarum]
MYDRVYCTVAFEPKATYDRPVVPPDSLRALMVHLNFDVLEGNAPRPRFRSFLKALPTATFSVYRTDSSSDLALVDAADLVLSPFGTPLADRVDEIVAWIGLQVDGPGINGGRWIGTDPTVGSVYTADQLDASNVLSSAALWVAPLPQDAGLVRYVELKAAAAFDFSGLVILPFFNGMSAPSTIQKASVQNPEGRELDITYDAGLPAGSLIVCRTLPTAEPKLDPTSLVDEEVGFLRINKEAALLHSTFEQVRNKTGSLFWPFTPLQALEWRSLSDGRLQTGQVRRLIWRAMNGLATLLDPLLVSLKMPPGSPEGPFVSALVGEILKRVPEADPVEIKKFVRERLDDHLTATPKENSDAERKEIVSRLRNVFKIAANNTLLSKLMDQYVTPGPAGGIEADLDPVRRRFGENSDDPAALDRQLCSELGDLATKMHSEVGIEQLLSTLFEVAGINASSLFAKFSVGTEPDWHAAMEAFNSFLATSLNGLDAAHHAQATVYEMALVREVKLKGETLGLPSSQWGHALLLEAIREANWFAQRLTKDGVGAFSAISSSCPVYATKALNTTDIIVVQKEMKRLYNDVLASMLPANQLARFIPDHAPRALPIQISVDADTTDLNNFAERFNGVSVLIKREDRPWAYANLAHLEVVGSAIDVDEPTIHPLQFVNADGQRQLFLEFNGSPFSSNVMSEFSMPQEEPSTVSYPFYTVDAPTKGQLGTMDALAPLAYGMAYRVAAHVVTSSGALPKTLQKDKDSRWKPVHTIDPHSIGAEFIQDQSYLRTTSIGRTLLNEKTDGTAPRIGVNIDRVYPLFGDFPKVGLTGVNGTPACLDVLRNAEGTGAFTLPAEGVSASVELTNLMWWGGAGKLTVELFLQPNPKPGVTAASMWVFDIGAAFEDGSLSINFVGEKEGWQVSAMGPDGAIVVGNPKSVAAPKDVDNPSCWLRIAVKGNANSTVSLSMRDQSGGFRSANSAARPPTGNLVLVAPTGSEWLPQYEKAVRAEIVFPKVTYEDFDRWYNNPRFATTPDAGTKAKFENARKALLAGSLARTIDDRLSKLIDALPDPAIEKVLVELVPLDGLSKKPPDMVVGYQGTARVIVLDEIYKRPLPDINNLKMLVTSLANLAKHHSAALTISSTGTTLTVSDPARTPQTAPYPRVEPEWTLEVNVPRGLVAQLSVRPLLSVANALMFDERIQELATEKRMIDGVEYFVMDGARLIIESMLGVLAAPVAKNDAPWLSVFAAPKNEWADLVVAATEVLDAGKERRYDLSVRPEYILQHINGWRWRQLGSIDIQTQRWRHTGRPIYSWFDPKVGRAAPVTTPAVALANDLLGLGPFVNEAFFDRDDEDADVQTSRLNAFPKETRLQAFPWEKSSATLFRHRLIVRSRYAGALRLGETSEVPAWEKAEDDRKFTTWTHVAMLADQTRLQLTRSRLRALMPLTQDPEGSPSLGATTPPIMAMLDEAPFFHGGLADRIGAEIKTGFGYEMAKKKVGLKDSRKEIGPDPRLTYFPLDLEAALAMSLVNEGPIGLTFDTVSVRAPSFANTALVLSPVYLGKGAAPIDLEEHFLSVALRRYLDHRWVVEHDAVPNKPSCSEPWWIELDEPQTLTCSQIPVCEISIVDDSFAVNFNPELLYSGGENVGHLVPVCKASRSAVGGLALQYLPLEAGRASISVFGLPTQDGYLGGNSPIMLATVEWALPADAKTLEFDGKTKVHRTSASPTTSMNWTRTGRNFELLSSFDEADDTTLSRHPVSAVTIKEINGAYRFATKNDAKALALEASLNTAPNPLYVHRHLAVVKSLNVQSAGRLVEVYAGAQRLLGDKVPISSGDGSIRVVEFETPAVPVCWNLANGVTGLDHFKSAHFDLFSLLGTKFTNNLAQAPIGLSLFLRPLAGTEGNKRITSISFSLAPKPVKSGASAPPAGQYSVALPTGMATPVRGIVLEVIGGEPNVARNAAVTATVIYGGGETRTIRANPITDVAFSVFNCASIDVVIDSISGISANTEFWADMSLLTLPRATSPEGTSFTFDWFFTGSETEAAEAISVRSLGGMVEAQARIISVSSPIVAEG